jgi:hypothetical protein
MSLISMVGTTVEAGSIGGFTTIGINSVAVDSILKQLQNASKTLPAYEVVMFLQQVSARCKNPAGQIGEANNGKPFNLNIAVVSQAQSIPDSIVKNGRAPSDIFFSNDDLQAAVEAELGKVCNPNWTLDKIVVNKMQVFGTLFSCEGLPGNQDNPRGVCPVDDALGKQCSAPPGQDLFNTTFNYNCTKTICDDPNTPCLQPPRLDNSSS